MSEKINVLDDLLKGYDDGRRKTLFCTVVNLLDLKDVRSVMGQIGNEVLPDAPLKEKSAAAVRLFEDMAGKRGISLKLRRKAENKS